MVDPVLYRVPTMMTTRSRSAAAIQIAVLCMSCAVKRAVIPSSPRHDTSADVQCFQACRGEVDCVARCPGAVVSAQNCAYEQLCVQERSLGTAGKVAVAVGVVAAVAAVLNLFAAADSN